ncbi:class I SAM-dependent DNA methyltransferase [Mesorhizobium australicum]|uniref:site-specific DNA-methyltransferase (adenine-specific) n=1 Tax=Mesorhizobium australicum TaxID=536018 RepID=A0A1X7N3S8_9HYPH|nr:DNA methyltransferase [Mesorhizobium australicum]SMH32013.1 Type II restriction/modification system, DNA methylase subunit YeeA [Mesorhizobium australicum]
MALGRAHGRARRDGGSGVDAEDFIRRWTAREGGAERANYQMFLSELCDVIAVDRPRPAGAETGRNDYVFERAVRTRDSDDVASSKRIDLYKKGCFILEAKQSRMPGAKNAIPGQLPLPDAEPESLGRRSAARGWDAMMQNARRQAEAYVFLLDASQPAPPFIVTCDVGHAFEIFADFTGTGRAYGQFPDRKGFRIYMEDLRRPETRDLLAKIWTDPASLDPARESARVTRAIARRLAEVSKALEAKHAPEEVAHFLMRCIFTMFAEDVDLLPRGKFTDLLQDCISSPGAFVPLIEELWAKMDNPAHERRFFSAFRAHLRHFNGNLFKDARAVPLGREEIGELLEAARAKWTEVDPAIFGTLLEQALEPGERRKLGAHYTPRSYVQRLVEVTVMEPLREDWERALTKAEDAKERGEEKTAAAIVRAFHHGLCTTRVLDPACGTGNFLYVSLELMKRLEGEVLETLARLGVSESLGLERETVDPHQFLGLELNPRAAAIAELVVWIGYLQQHYRTHTGHPAEPILKAFANINFGRRDGYDAVLTWDGYPLPTVADKNGKRVETYPNARRPDWPEAEFIVGNPPFMGGKDMRSRLGSAYVETLWAVHKHMNESADFVMYWWDRAAELLTRKASPLRRFGLVTTNSISQVFQRRVMERHLNAKNPMSLVFAIADHPWTKATKDSAAVRIAMTVGEAGKKEGTLYEVMEETGLDTDEPRLEFGFKSGAINSDLTTGVNVATASPLLATQGLCSRGVQLMGSGFIVTRTEAEHLGLHTRPGLVKHVKSYRNGRDLTAHPRNVMVIDLFGLSAETVRRDFPEVYQHLTERVRYDLDEHGKPRTDKDGRKLGREWNNRGSYRQNWWIFGEPRGELRPALDGLPRYIATVETTKHRVFQFLDASILADNMIVVVAIPDAAILAILSSRIHTSWAPTMGGWLGYGNDPRYSKSRCFDPFPFPELSEALRQKLREAGEELDALRKRVLAEHPDLTLTGLYNVLEKLRGDAPSTASRSPSPAGGGGSALTAKEEDIKNRGLVLILKELHETIDRLTAQAYGWPADLPGEEILARLVALNAERAKEEAAGHVRWLRPDYQIPRFAKGAPVKTGELDLGETVVAIDSRLPAWPKDKGEQTLAVETLLGASGRPMDVAALARGFRGGGRRIEPRVAQVLRTLALYGRASALANGRYVAPDGRHILRKAA